MPNDAIDISLIGGKLEYLDKLCRAKRTAGEEFKEACKAIGQEARCEGGVFKLRDLEKVIDKFYRENF